MSTLPSLLSISFATNGELKPDGCLVLTEVDDIDLNRVVDDSITSFTFTGKHDHGLLQPLKSTGHTASLISAIQQAKAHCDLYLTQQIQIEAGSADADGADAEGEVEDTSEDPVIESDIPKPKKIKK